MGLVYVFGEKGGADIKIGSTNDPLWKRLRGVNDDLSPLNHAYVLLAAMKGNKTGERMIHRYFDGSRSPKGTRQEYFTPTEPLIEYVLWLRQQHFVTSLLDGEEDIQEMEPDAWLPKVERRIPRPPIDPAQWLQSTEQIGESPLAGTYWSFMPDPLHSFQDYFTPPDIVRRAARAMGGIDLDAASHYLANRKFRQAGIEIRDYFTVNRSAFDNEWRGRVWLNPPYGDNERWFARSEAEYDAGHMTQLCMLSPMWAFTIKAAQAWMRRATATIILSPTPSFENPGDRTKTGSNLPHAIFYWGERAREFLDAYEGVGIPAELR